MRTSTVITESGSVSKSDHSVIFVSADLPRAETFTWIKSQERVRSPKGNKRFGELFYELRTGLS